MRLFTFALQPRGAFVYICITATWCICLHLHYSHVVHLFTFAIQSRDVFVYICNAVTWCVCLHLHYSHVVWWTFAGHNTTSIRNVFAENVLLYMYVIFVCLWCVQVCGITGVASSLVILIHLSLTRRNLSSASEWLHPQKKSIYSKKNVKKKHFPLIHFPFLLIS